MILTIHVYVFTCKIKCCALSISNAVKVQQLKRGGRGFVLYLKVLSSNHLHNVEIQSIQSCSNFKVYFVQVLSCHRFSEASV